MRAAPRSPNANRRVDSAVIIQDHEEMPRLSRDGVIRFLRDETLFRAVSGQAMNSLSDAALQKVVPKDGTLFTMGQTCDALHFVADGCGLLMKVAPDGQQRILHRAIAGDMVGAVPFFDGLEYPATFIAETECVVLSFPRTTLLSLFTNDPTLSLAVIGGLVDRLRMMSGLVEQMSFDDAEHRLWDYLLKSSRGPAQDGFPRVLDPIPTREHIANSIGTVREVVSRRLSKLADTGHLRIDGRRLELLKPLK